MMLQKDSSRHVKRLLYGFNRRKQCVCVSLVSLLKKTCLPWRRLEMLQAAVSGGQIISDRIILSTFLCFHFFQWICLTLPNLKADPHGYSFTVKRPQDHHKITTSVRFLACSRGNCCPRRQAPQEGGAPQEGA